MKGGKERNSINRSKTSKKKKGESSGIKPSQRKVKYNEISIKQQARNSKKIQQKVNQEKVIVNNKITNLRRISGTSVGK
jgi:hypothetical protein